MRDQQFYCSDAGWWDIRPRNARQIFRKKDAAPAPTPDPAIGQAAAGNIELGKQQLELAKQQYADNKVRQDGYDKLTGQVAESALATQNLSNQWAQQDRDIQAGYRDLYDQYAKDDRAYGRDVANTANNLGATADKSAQQYESIYGDQAKYQAGLGQSQVNRYNNTFAPVEDKVVSDAMSWDSADRQASLASQAKADTVAAGQQARDATNRSLASMGVNPNSGKFAATAGATDTAVALAGAGAQNVARDNVRLQGVQLRQQAAQLGQQVLSSGQQANSLSMQATQAAQNARQTGFQSQLQAQNLGLAATGVGNSSAALATGQQGAGYTGLGTGLNAGSSAVGAAGAANGNNLANNSALMNGFTGAINANASGAGIANSLYGSQLNAWNAQNQSNASSTAGIAGGLGSLAGAGAALYL